MVETVLLDHMHRWGEWQRQEYHGRLLLDWKTPTSGSVLYRGKALGRPPANGKTEFRREVQAVFQDPFAAYNPLYKVDHVLEVPIAKFASPTTVPIAWP